MRLKDLREELEKDQEYLEEKRSLKPLLDLANQILDLRMERGWSQSELARRVGTRQSNISRIESGLANPTFKFLQKLAKAFDVDISIHLEKEGDLTEEGIFTSGEKQIVIVHVNHIIMSKQKQYGDYWTDSPLIPVSRERIHLQ